MIDTVKQLIKFLKTLPADATIYFKGNDGKILWLYPGCFELQPTIKPSYRVISARVSTVPAVQKEFAVYLATEPLEPVEETFYFGEPESK